MNRIFTPSEVRGLNESQKNYLTKNPHSYSLQLQMLPREALYKTRHGAVTIDHAIYLEEPGIQQVISKLLKSNQAPFDNYSMAEDSFIDRHGVSSSIF